MKCHLFIYWKFLFYLLNFSALLLWKIIFLTFWIWFIFFHDFYSIEKYFKFSTNLTFTWKCTCHTILKPHIFRIDYPTADCCTGWFCLRTQERFLLYHKKTLEQIDWTGDISNQKLKLRKWFILPRTFLARLICMTGVVWCNSE